MPSFRLAATAALSVLVAAAAALFLLVAAPAAAQPAQVVVQVWSFGFGPQPIRLAAGKPVTLTFVNQAVTATISPQRNSSAPQHHRRRRSGRQDRARGPRNEKHHPRPRTPAPTRRTAATSSTHKWA